MCRDDNLATFMYRLSENAGSPRGISWPYKSRFTVISQRSECAPIMKTELDAVEGNDCCENYKEHSVDVKECGVNPGSIYSKYQV